MRVRALRGVCGLALTAGVVCATAGAAVALQEVKPFGVAKFTMQTTHTDERIGAEGHTFENVPYTFTQAGGHPWALTTTVEFATKKSKLRPEDVIVDRRVTRRISSWICRRVCWAIRWPCRAAR